ncbi:hypothetical protein [Nocardiopsis xinjiangensis]|uniref:hypothetical protein n=1 Tax=Nocardiopsis xinjiangensis TaxID=124285 RepID=UPI00034AD2D0|nr:hypothetical protein [Nocardiopsis xinjiangensis]
MILSILATVAVLAAIAVMLSALVFAETVLVYIALGLGATSVLLLVGALVQQRSGTTGPEPELSGTDGLGKSSVPVTQAGALATGATAMDSVPDTAEPEDSRRVPAPASEPVRDVSVPGTDTVEEGTEYGDPEYEVPRWQTPTQGDRPAPDRGHVPAPEECTDEERTSAPAATAGASVFDDEEVPFSNSVREAEAESEESGDPSWNFPPVADTVPDEEQTSAPEQAEPEEAPATARDPGTDDGEPVNEDGTDASGAEALEDDEPAEALEDEGPATELSGPREDADPELTSDTVDGVSEDDRPAESVRSSDEDRGTATEVEPDTEGPAEAEDGQDVPEDGTASAEAGTEEPLERESADDDPVPAPEAGQDEEPGQATEDGPSVDGTAAEDSDAEQVPADADTGTPEDEAGEHAVAYAVIVDSDPAARETDTVSAEDPGSSR